MDVARCRSAIVDGGMGLDWVGQPGLLQLKKGLRLCGLQRSDLGELLNFQPGTASRVATFLNTTGKWHLPHTCPRLAPICCPYQSPSKHYPSNQSYIDIFRCGHLVCIPAADWLLWRPPPPKLCRRITHALDLMNSLWPESLTTCRFLWIGSHV